MGQKVPVPDERLSAMIDKLRLKKKEIAKLYSVFNKHDDDKSGTIEAKEFYNIIKEPQTLFGDAIFSIIDLDGSGTLDFGEFVEAVGTFCMFGKMEILKFCFFIFDKDKSGSIEEDEMTSLIETLQQGEAYSNTKQALLGAFDEDGDGKMSFKEFVETNEKYPQMLFPAFKIQDKMAQCTLGRKWWLDRKAMFAAERQKEVDDKKKAKEAAKLKHVENQKKQIRRRIGWFNYYFNSTMRDKYFAEIDYGVDEEALAREKKEAEEKEMDRQKELELLAQERARAMRMMNKNPPPPPSKPHVTTDMLRSTHESRAKHRIRREQGFIPPKERRKMHEKEKKKRRKERKLLQSIDNDDSSYQTETYV